MAKTKICPKCGSKTKSCLWNSQKAVATNSSGKTLVHPTGETAYGYPMRKCKSCAWVGDFVIIPLPPTPPPASTRPLPPEAIMDDDDEDYINHFYH